ncbi:MAG: ribosome silencing factor [Polaromonas sp.]|nr:ribosome silencing factor [Polaromonas sp.]
MTNTPVKTPVSDKKDVQKLQRAIVDGLEDVKAQDIQVFDTEHITALFERVIIASGTSNRQTKALAASVRDAVRDAGFGKPRIEGEENGEWIIVDCGAAVAHIMQPTIRQYYHLEELWGDKPVKLKLGAAVPAAARKASHAEPEPEAKPAARKKPGVKTAGKSVGKSVGKAAPAKRAASPSSPPDSSYIGRVGRTYDWTAKRNATQTASEPLAPAVKPARKAAAPAKSASAKVPTKAPTRSPAKAPAKRPAVKVIGKPAAHKVAAKKVAAKKPIARKTPATGR